MKTSHFKFQIDQLKKDKMLLAIESIAAFVFSLFISIMLPSLLVRYVYANQQLFEQPKVLEYIPVFSFAVGVGFFIYAIVNLFIKKNQINQLTRELDDAISQSKCGDCCCGSCQDEVSQTELAKLDKMAEQVIKKSKTSSKKRKTATKKQKSK